jgi:hypothetical protein
LDFESDVWSNKIEEYLSSQGLACITIITFDHNDGNQSAAAALARVWKAAKGPGFELVTRGECNANLLDKAKKITQADEVNKRKEPTFDEKTQEAIKLSLADQGEKLVEIKENLTTLQQGMEEKVATKEDLVKIDETIDVISFNMVTKEDLAALQQGMEVNVATKEYLAKSLEQGMEVNVATKEYLAKSLEQGMEDTGKVLASVSSVESTFNVKIDDVKKTIVEDKAALDKMLNKMKHAEHITFELRGKIGAESSKKVKQLRRENEVLKRQLKDRDNMLAPMEKRLKTIEAYQVELIAKSEYHLDNLARMDDRLTRVEARLVSVDDRITRVEARLTPMDDRLMLIEANQVELLENERLALLTPMDTRLRMMEAYQVEMMAQDDTHNDRLTRVEAAQAKIIEKLDQLLSKN